MSERRQHEKIQLRKRVMSNCARDSFMYAFLCIWRDRLHRLRNDSRSWNYGVCPCARLTEEKKTITLSAIIIYWRSGIFRTGKLLLVLFFIHFFLKLIEIDAISFL